MMDWLKSIRKLFFYSVASEIKVETIQLIVVTHFLDDRPELVAAFEQVAPIALLIGVPYSSQEAIVNTLSQRYPVITPTLEQLNDRDYMLKKLQDYLLPDKDIVILEVGGYFSACVQMLKKLYGDRFIGAIEDTEAGHRRYEQLQSQLCCPVVSVARSKLKDSEDFLIGDSCVYSLERLLRRQGFPLTGRKYTIIGFGKVGRGVAYALSRQHCHVIVYDKDPVQRIKALSEGFAIASKDVALQESDVILGATGQYALNKKDFLLLKNNALLVSCSSRDIEFDLTSLDKHFDIQYRIGEITAYQRADKHVYLANNGRPINFIDGAVVGPVLSLVQAELIVAIKELLELKKSAGLFEVSSSRKTWLAEMWIEYFCNKETGFYHLAESQSHNRLPMASPLNIVNFGG